MNCQRCGKVIPEQIDYCPSCKINEIKSQNNHANPDIDTFSEHEEQIQREEESKPLDSLAPKNNKWATISLIASLVPMFLILFFPVIRPFFASVIKHPQMILLYRLVSLFPIIAIVIAIVCGIKGLNSERRSLAIFALINNTLILLAVLVFGL